MAHEISAVLEYGAPQPGETTTTMEDKLRFHTDSWDLSVDLKAGVSEIDARSCDAYAAGDIPGATSFPHREMSVETTARLDRSKVYVVYCDGIGCNASTKGARTNSLGWGFAPRSCWAASIGDPRRTPCHDFA
jgi:rhodanese-related sulfurtransferase